MQKKKIFLDEETIRGVLDGDSESLDLMMRSYEATAAAMIFRIASQMDVEVTVPEADELIHRMWIKIVVDRLYMFNKL